MPRKPAFDTRSILWNRVNQHGAGRPIEVDEAEPLYVWANAELAAVGMDQPRGRTANGPTVKGARYHRIYSGLDNPRALLELADGSVITSEDLDRIL